MYIFEDISIRYDVTKTTYAYHRDPTRLVKKEAYIV